MAIKNTSRVDLRSSEWEYDRDRMVNALRKAEDNGTIPSVKHLSRFRKYSNGTKAALVANFTRGAY